MAHIYEAHSQTTGHTPPVKPIPLNLAEPCLGSVAFNGVFDAIAGLAP